MRLEVQNEKGGIMSTARTEDSVIPEPFQRGQVNSVLGVIALEELGATLMHEHFSFTFPGWYADATIAPYDVEKFVEPNLVWLKEVKELGIDTVVDATPNDCGRDPLLYKTLAQKSGINIICSTGLYDEHSGASRYWTFRQGMGFGIEAEIHEMFFKEITEGIGNTGVRAGVIKVGTSMGEITPYETAVLKAAARAGKETGVPIITHTEGPTMGPEQADLFLGEGIDPTQVMIGHMNNSSDINYHLSILERPGFVIGFDRTSLGPSDELEHIIVELCQRGYADRICLSHDYVPMWLGRHFEFPDMYKAYVAEYHPTYVSAKFIPRLKAAGVTQEQIDTIMIANPRKLFTAR